MLEHFPNTFEEGFKIIADNYERLILEPEEDKQFQKLLGHLEFKNDDELNKFLNEC